MSQLRRTKSSSTQQLVDDLLAESHGLRMKYEDFSRYTEAQVAEFVLTKRRLNRELAELGERAKFLTQKVDQLENANTHLEQIRAHLTGESARLTKELEATREHLGQQLAHVQAERDAAKLERDAAQAEAVRIGVELRHAHGDIALLHEQRAMVQGELVKITHECSALQAELSKRTEQRNRLRNRVEVLESSRAYRVSQAIQRLLRRTK
jgi:chromosome segregation ATPase